MKSLQNVCHIDMITKRGFYVRRLCRALASVAPGPGAAAGHFEELPDQVIANEYLPGQGISAHVDCEPCLSDTIVSLSLLSSCEMLFGEKASGARLGVILEPCSLVVMKDGARYAWTQEIPAQKRCHPWKQG